MKRVLGVDSVAARVAGRKLRGTAARVAGRNMMWAYSEVGNHSSSQRLPCTAEGGTSACALPRFMLNRRAVRDRVTKNAQSIRTPQCLDVFTFISVKAKVTYTPSLIQRSCAFVVSVV